jgi:hypothetical protein
VTGGWEFLLATNPQPLTPFSSILTTSAKKGILLALKNETAFHNVKRKRSNPIMAVKEANH